MNRLKTQQANYAFIDSQNLNLGTQKMGWKMDWRKFRKFLKDQYNVSHAYMFIGYVPEFEQLYEQMHDSGYLVVLKPTQDMTKLHPEKPTEGKEVEGEDKKPIKGNIDADLVLWAMKELPNYNKAVIVSGDGDFHSLIEYLVERKKLSHVLTPNWQYSQLLNQFDNYIVRLDKLQRQLAYRRRLPKRQAK